MSEIRNTPMEVQEDRQSLLGLGTMPEWIGLVLIIAGMVWTGSTVVNDMRHQMSQQEALFNKQVAKIIASVEKIELALDTQSRIVKLERKAALGAFEKVQSENTGRVNRLYENIDIAWNHIRANEGFIRELREKSHTPSGHVPAAKE